MKIIEAKQVGKISYCVSSLEVLYKILETNSIKQSNNTESDFNHKNQHYISFSRDLLSHPRKDPRWAFGIILDGDKLSNRYSFEPISFIDTQFKTNKLRIKEIASYDNGEYIVRFVNYSALKISKSVYQNLENIILNQSEEINNKKHLQILGQGKPRSGKSRINGYRYNSPNGLTVSSKDLSQESQVYLAKMTDLNETEERIWLRSHQDYINIKGTILGIILPKDLKEKYENPNININSESILAKIKSFGYDILYY